MPGPLHSLNRPPDQRLIHSRFGSAAPNRRKSYKTSTFLVQKGCGGVQFPRFNGSKAFSCDYTKTSPFLHQISGVIVRKPNKISLLAKALPQCVIFQIASPLKGIERK